MKTALITGTSSGIGKATAELLLMRNWKVYGLSRRQPEINNNNFTWLSCDLNNAEQISYVLKSINEATIDALVSNAGVAFKELATAATNISYEKMFAVNVLAPMLLVNGLKDKLERATIISVSSVSDRIADKNFALYCSSKAANTRYFESLADELRQARVYTLLPDYVNTPMLREVEDMQDFNKDTALDVKDVAKLTGDLIEGSFDLISGSNIIIVNDHLKDDLQSVEKLYGFNTDTGELSKL